MAAKVIGVLLLAACTTASVPPPTSTNLQTVTLLWANAAPAVNLLAKPGFALFSSVGPDFSVHHLVPTGESADSRRGVGIYVGNYPTLHRSRNPKSQLIADASGIIAGQTIDWTCWNTAERETPLMCETIVAGLVEEPKSTRPTVLHVWVMGRDASEIALFRELAQSQIVRVRKHAV